MSSPRYKDRSMQQVYENLLKLAVDPTSELYHNGKPRRGAIHRCAFWDGFNGLEKSSNAINKQSMAWAAFQAGKEFARQNLSTSTKAVSERSLAD